MSVKLIQLGKYTMPTISENTRNNWVTYGEDNDYFDTLLTAKDSPTNGALINSISSLIYGKGLHATDANRKPDEYAQMAQLFSEDCTRKISVDLYGLGMYAIQVIYDTKHTQIVSVEHMPIQNLRPEKCNEDGDIENYYYSDNWGDIRPNDEVKKIPAFGMSKEGLEVLVVKPYKSGFHYFSPVEWQSGIDYAFVEIELAKFHLNNIYNRFSANMLINFNNGRPSDDQRRTIEKSIKDKFTGTEGESVIVAFNDNKDSAATIETPQLNDAHNQYQFISEEAARKLMVSHKVTSPLLFGLPANGGWGSNAEEIEMSSKLFDNTVIKPLQQLIIEGVEKVLSFNGVSLNVYMVTSQPLEFTDVKVNEVANEVVEEKTGVEMSSQVCCSAHGNDGIDMIADDLISLGEDIGEGWEMIEESEVDYSEDAEPSFLSKIFKFVSTGTARPNDKSEQDAVINGVQYKTRYVYSPERASADSRNFCKKMVAAKKLYRKEDIVRMDSISVNAGFGEGGANTYSIWKFKGGARCHHKWLRRVYRKEGARGSIDTKSPNAPTISTNKSEKEGYRVRNPKEVAMKPNDMPNNGFVNPR
jgi:hypothetical protein